jgi:hypothetical protein
LDEAAVREHRAAHWPWVFALLLAAPTLLVRSPPMTDLAMHAGAVGLLTHWGDDSFVPKGLYWLNLGRPNQLFYAIAYVTSELFGPRAGIGLAAALAQVGVIGGGGVFARHVKAPWWSSLWLAPLALGWTYFWGLVPNLYGLALFLPTLVLVDRLVAEPTWRRAAALTGGYVLLFFAHETAMAAALAVHALFVLLRPSKRAWAILTAPAVGAVVLGVLDWRRVAPHLTSTEKAIVGDVVFTSPLARARELPETIFGSYPMPVLLALSVLFAGAVWATLRAESSNHVAPSLRARLWNQRFALAGAGMLLGYFVAPSQAVGVTMLHSRFASYAWALVLPGSCAGLGFTVTSGRGARVAPRLAPLAAVASLLALLVVAMPAFAQSHQLNVAFDRVIAKMDRGQASLVSRLHPRAADDLFTAVSCGRVLAMRGGRCQFDFTRTSISPVRISEPLLWKRVGNGEDPDGVAELRLPGDLHAYRYVVLCCATDAERDDYAKVLAPYATLVTSDDGWLLFESKLPRIAVNAPEPPALAR